MPYKTIKVLTYFMLSFSLITCNTPEPVSPVESVLGYKPIYATPDDYAIEFLEPRSVQKPGKIYSYGNYLLVNEQQKGIHFFNNANPSSSTPIGFLTIQGNVDMAIKNDVLYADHISNIVALDITDLNNIKELSRVKSWNANSLPPNDRQFFECVNADKGEVIGWDQVTLTRPECRHNVTNFFME